MTNRMQHQTEMVGETATLYVRGTLGYENVETLIETCAAMPASVRTLRLDLHGLGQLSAEATGTVRLLLAHWRESRRGDFRLSTSHMLATLRDVTDAYGPPAGLILPRMNEALAATYL